MADISVQTLIQAYLPSGYSGYSGYSGLGLSGYSGISGYSGTSGYSGISGYSGTSGTSGFSGASGTSGFSGSGVSGFSGASGISGFSGASGISGFSGASGISGFSGASGISGFSGTSGFSGFVSATDFWQSSPLFINTTTLAQASGTAFVQPIDVPNLNASIFKMFATQGLTVNASIVTTNVSRNLSMSYGGTQFYGIYSQGTGVNTDKIYSLSTFNLPWGLAFSLNDSGSSHSYYYTFSYPYDSVISTFTSSLTSARNQVNFFTSQFSGDFAGQFGLYGPMSNLTLSRGEYWIVFSQNTASTAQGALTGFSQLAWTNNLYFMTQADLNFDQMKPVNSTLDSLTHHLEPGLGSVTTNASGFISPLNFSQISTRASNPKLYVQIMNTNLDI